MNTAPLFLLLTALLTAPSSYALFTKVPGIDSAHITRVALSRGDPSFIAVTSRNFLYISRDNGLHFKKLTGVKDEQIVHMFIDETRPPTLYMAGDRQCYKIDDTSAKIFSASNDEKINFISKHRDRIYIASSTGLYYANESQLDWKSVPGLRTSEVYSVEGLGDSVYLACDTGAYRLRSDGRLIRLFVTHDGEGSTLKLNLLKPDAHNPNRLWLCTNKGVFYSTDLGETWGKFYTSGASHLSAYSLSQSPEPDCYFYLCTDAGLFKVNIDDGNARPLFEGLSSSVTSWMDFNESGEIYLATDQGLFTNKRPAGAHQPSRARATKTESNEPTIREVQEAALRYNSIHPGKVNTWRKELKYRALFPKVSVDYDNSMSTYQGSYYTGPGKWGVSLSWDMGDLIWNSYEDDVDNRSKLTTQLRIDILDEINRLYFERLRLKQEIAATDQDTRDEHLKELRLQELTATLDGYTGGFLSRSSTR